MLKETPIPSRSDQVEIKLRSPYVYFNQISMQWNRAQSSTVSMASRSVPCALSLPVQYRLHMYLDDLRSSSQRKVTNLELRKIRIALPVLSCIPVLECFTALESWVVWRLAAYLSRRKFLLVSINKTFSLTHRSHHIYTAVTCLSLFGASDIIAYSSIG